MERLSKSQAEWVQTRTAEQTRTTGEPTVNGEAIYTAKTPDGIIDGVDQEVIREAVRMMEDK